MRRESSQLNSNYIILDYIEPKLGAVIDPLMPTSWNTYTIEIQYMKTTSHKNMSFFGSCDIVSTDSYSTANWSGIAYFVDSARVYIAIGSSNALSSRYITLNQKRTYSLTVNKTNHTILINDNGTSVSNSWSGNITQNNIILFGDNTSGFAREHTYGIKYYYCKITVDGTLIRDFVPAMNSSTGQVGLYDQQGSICPLTNTPLYIPASYFDYGTIS